MEPESRTLTANHQPNNLHHLLSPLVPVLLIAISYLDPGKWAAHVEGGARYGTDMVFLLLLFNVVAILCQHLSARVAVVTGRDLSQICSEEYDKITCIFLGFQAELSMIMLDLTMVLGTAHGLNTVLGIDLFTCVFLTIMAAFLFPLLATLLENGKAKCLCICMASTILLAYFFGVLISQPETSFSMGGFLTHIGGESAFVLMGLLGASIMPHNFYLHSSIVQQNQAHSDLSKEDVCHYHLFATVCIFSGVFLVNYVVMNLAANVFFSAGLVLLTFQDALSLMDQVFRSSLVPFALVVILFVSNQIMALTWNLSRRMVINDFFGMDIPGWLHYATIRIIAIVPALCCVWTAGAEGIYQLLILAQVLVALLLPSSVIPLFRVASSLSIMGTYKISRAVEFLALFIFICMIGLKVTFVIEMVFGKSEWASNLRWSAGSNVPISYIVLLLIASVSFCFMLWLAATPLKSASSRLDAHAWGVQSPLPEAFLDRYQTDVGESKFPVETTEMQEPVVKKEKTLDNHSDMSKPIHDLNLPESLLDSGNSFHLTTVDENKSEVTFSGSSVGHPEVITIEEPKVTTTEGKVFEAADCSEASDVDSTDTNTQKSEPIEMVEKSVRMEGHMQNENDEEGHTWEPEEPSKGMLENSQPLMCEGGSGSFRSLGGKGDDVGSGTGSLSRLAGLGRAARRQLTAILDEFWAQLFNFYGQPTQEARAKKLNLLLGLDSKVDSKSSPVSAKLDSRKEFAGYLPSSGGRGSDSFMQSSLYNSPRQQISQGLVATSHGVVQGSSLWPNHVQLQDAYANISSHSAFEASERRCSSMHIPASSDGYDQQPATVHGYEIATYLSRLAKERGSNNLNGQMDLLAPKSSSSVIFSKPTSSLMSNSGDSLSHSLAQKPQSTLRPPGFHNVPVPRNSSLQSERPYNELSSPKTVEATASAVNVKKFYSLPDISGLYIPQQDSQFPGNSSQWDKSMGSGHSVARSAYEQNYPSTLLRAGAPMTLDGLSPSKVCGGAFPLQFTSGSGSASLWSRQPFEQFGVAEKSVTANTGQGWTSQGFRNEETSLAVDMEGKLIQSFRYCILKLLKLEGSDWLFRQNDGADEDLIDRVAARERFHYELETKQMNRPGSSDAHFSPERKPVSSVKSDESDYTKFSMSLSPYCGEGCVYRVDLIVSFGVWCIHRILELSLMESRPELWGKYTYVLNRLQGIIDLAFFKPRPPPAPCFCLDLPPGWQQRPSMGASNGSLPPPAKIGRGKFTTAAMLLDIIKDVETAIQGRKGRSGTAAGDVAFPRGKENIASVLKRYRRRLSNKPVGSQESGSGPRKVSSLTSYGL